MARQPGQERRGQHQHQRNATIEECSCSVGIVCRHPTCRHLIVMSRSGMGFLSTSRRGAADPPVSVSTLTNKKDIATPVTNQLACEVRRYHSRGGGTGGGSRLPQQPWLWNRGCTRKPGGVRPIWPPKNSVSPRRTFNARQPRGSLCTVTLTHGEVLRKAWHRGAGGH